MGFSLAKSLTWPATSDTEEGLDLFPIISMNAIALVQTNAFSQQSGEEMLWGRSVWLVEHVQDPQSLRRRNEHEKKA